MEPSNPSVGSDDLQLPSIFLSYARADNEDGFVTSVYEALQKEGFSVWWDRANMPSRALTFLQEIREAISSADRLLLILSPTAANSKYVRAEWQYALVSDKVVTPVLRAGSFNLLPPELKGTHCEDVRATRDTQEALAAVVRLSKDFPPPLGRAETVPVPPPYYKPRPDQLTRVAECLALGQPEQLAVPPQERMFMICGMGGVGKSVLAAAIARSTATRRVFSDGVIWVPSGLEAQVLSILQQIGRRLGEDVRDYENEAEARVNLRRRLEHSAVLIVLDNVWRMETIESLREALGPRCRLLITAREPGLADLGTPVVNLEPFSEEEALAYLADRAQAAGRPISPAMADVARECGFLPFALALAGAMVASTSWERMLERLRAADLSFMQAKIPNYPYTNLLRALQVSVDQLRESADPDDQMALQRYLEIPAFRWEGTVTEAAIMTVWKGRSGIDFATAERMLTFLANRGLVRTEGQSPDRLVILHDLQQDYLWGLAKDRPSEHAAILEAYAHIYSEAPFISQDDGYYLDNYFYHLEHAQQADEMHAILKTQTTGGRNAWWAARIAHGQVLGFAADVRRASEHAWQGVSDQNPPDSTAVARTARYTLMAGSVRASLTDMPLHFVGRLLDEKIWSADQALAVLEWVARDGRRLDAFTAILPYLPKSRVHEAIQDGLQLARDQVESGDRASGLMKIVPFLEGIQRAEVLEEAIALSDIRRFDILLQAYRAEPNRADFLDNAMTVLEQTEGFRLKWRLIQLAKVVPAARVEELMPWISAVGSHEDQAEVLLELAARLPEPRRYVLSTKAFELLADGEDFKGAGVTAVKGRARAVRLLPPEKRPSAASDVVKEIEQLKWVWHRVAALADSIPFLEGAQRVQAEALAFEFACKIHAADLQDLISEGERGKWLAQEAPEFFQPLVNTLLDTARREQDSYKRTSAIAALLPFLDRDRLQAIFTEEEKRSQRINDVAERALCVAALARTLPLDFRENIIQRALDQITDREEPRPSGPELIALATLSTTKQLEALATILPRIDPLNQADTAAALFSQLAQFAYWDSALTLLPFLNSPFYLRQAFKHLPQHIPEMVARKLFMAAVNTGDPEFAGITIAAFFSHLSTQDQLVAIEFGIQAIEALDRGRDRYNLLVELVPTLPCERLSAIAALIPEQDENAELDRDRALIALACKQAECNQFMEAVHTAKSTKYADSLCRAYVRMSINFPEPAASTLLEQAEVAADRESSYSRVELLSEIARQRAEPHHSRLVEKALALAYHIEKGFIFSMEEEKARALAYVAPLVDIRRRRSVVMDAWENAPKSGAFGGVGTLETLAPLIAELEPSQTCSQWRADLQLASRERRLVLDTLRALAPVEARLGGESGVLAIIEAIEDVTRWWP